MFSAAAVLLYNILLESIYFVLYPILFLYLRYRGYLRAICNTQSDYQNGILIHAASVGEVNAVKSLVTELIARYPQFKISMTTTSLSGMKVAQAIHPSISVDISPLDIYHLRKKQFDHNQPALMIIVETEIWPNLLYIAKSKRIPIMFVNARMSEKTMNSFIKYKPILQYLSEPIVSICAQSEIDRKRFSEVFRIPVFNAGNLKFATILQDYNKDEQRQAWGYNKDDFIITFGSSRPGEEVMIRDVYLQIKPQIPNLRLIVAIRHINRIEEVKSILEGLDYAQLSETPKAKDIYLLDQMGFLNRAYAICDLAIVGGSFFDFGGHNPLEPAYYEKPIIMGKYHSSCMDSVQKLQTEDAILICDTNTLATQIQNLYQNESLRESLARNAKRVLTQNAGSLDYHLKEIERNLKQNHA